MITLYENSIAEEMLGANGTNRTNVRNELNAQTDRDAIEEWLRRRKRNSHETFRAYQREVRRLIMWCALFAKKPISSLTSQDLERYREFLADPPEDMIGWRAKWGNADWRPFASKMKPQSVNRSMLILSGMFAFLKAIRYLEFDPFEIIELDHSSRFVSEKTRRPLDAEQIAAIVSVFSEADASLRIKRTRFIIALMFFMGLRISEVVSLNTQNAFYEKEKGEWWIEILGKGKKLRSIPVPPAMIEELVIYRRLWGRTDLPGKNDDASFIFALRKSGKISERMIREDIKHVFKLAAERVSDTAKADMLRSASPHWLRHTYLTLQARQTQNMQEWRALQQNAGHSDIRTTMGYVHFDERERYNAVKHWRW